jgi:hypothetical protein
VARVGRVRRLAARRRIPEALVTFVKLTYPHDFDGTGRKSLWLDALAVTAVVTEAVATTVRCGGQRYDVAESPEQVLEMVIASRPPRAS